jgi:3-hydroxybutyryl-CoA dehydrogenase
MNEQLGIAGSGAIACGLAATAAQFGDVLLVARSDASAEKATAKIEKFASRLEDADPARVTVSTDLGALADRTFVVEAIAEEIEAKGELLGRIGEIAGDGAVIASTTSSLSVEQLATASGRADSFVALHVFNPVPQMKLVEVSRASATSDEAVARAVALCEALGKTPVPVPDVPGFVVNSLLFPYLFHAAQLMEDQGLDANAVDTCMTLGAGHPMGPLALLDFVGLDVSLAIGESIGATIPDSLRALVAEGALGRKTGRGYHDYSKK